MANDEIAEAGWYDNPEQEGELRWWNGHRWTDEVKKKPPPRKWSRFVAALFVLLISAATSFLAFFFALATAIGCDETCETDYGSKGVVFDDGMRAPLSWQDISGHPFQDEITNYLLGLSLICLVVVVVDIAYVITYLLTLDRQDGSLFTWLFILMIILNLVVPVGVVATKMKLDSGPVYLKGEAEMAIPLDARLRQSIEQKTSQENEKIAKERVIAGREDKKLRQVAEKIQNFYRPGQVVASSQPYDGSLYFCSRSILSGRRESWIPELLSDGSLENNLSKYGCRTIKLPIEFGVDVSPRFPNGSGDPYPDDGSQLVSFWIERSPLSNPCRQSVDIEGDKAEISSHPCLSRNRAP